MIDYETPTRAARVTIVVCGAILFLSLFGHLEHRHRTYCRFHADEAQCLPQTPIPSAME